MKILIVGNCIDVMGGVERVINALANGLSEEYDVSVLSEMHAKKRFFDYFSKVDVSYLLNKNIDDNEENALLRKMSAIYWKIARRKCIKKFMRDKKYDAIIFDRVYVALHFLPYIDTANTKIIVRDAIHLKSFDEKNRKKILKYFPGRVATFIVSSDESKAVYEDFFGKKSNIEIRKIYNPLGIKPKTGFNFKNKEIVSMGRMDDPQKGIDTLLKAYKKVNEKHPDWKLHIYGSESDNNNIASLIEKIAGAKSKIIVSPSTKDVVKALNETSIYVSAARYEGYANSVVEAMACGVPTVSFNWLMGVEEIINDGHDGVIVKLENRDSYQYGESTNADVENLASAICGLIENEERCRSFSQRAAKAMQNRNVDYILEEWRKLLV